VEKVCGAGRLPRAPPREPRRRRRRRRRRFTRNSKAISIFQLFIDLAFSFLTFRLKYVCGTSGGEWWVFFLFMTRCPSGPRGII